MPRSYRGIILALGLILSSPSHAKKADDQQARPGNDAARQLERIASAIEKRPVASAPDRGCDPSAEDRQSDLCAQWKAADAAADAARWAWWMLWASGAGLAIGGGTLFAAWRAAHWAREAAKHTEASAVQSARSAIAAEESLAESRKVYGIQMRPYVAFTDAGDEERQPFSRDTALKIKIKNFGMAPAHDVVLSVGAELCEEPIGDLVVPLTNERRGAYGFLAHGDTRSDSIYTRDVAVADIAEIARGEMKLLVRVRLDYTWPGGVDSNDMTLILSDPSTNEWHLLDENRRRKKTETH